MNTTFTETRPLPRTCELIALGWELRGLVNGYASGERPRKDTAARMAGQLARALDAATDELAADPLTHRLNGV